MNAVVKLTLPALVAALLGAALNSAAAQPLQRSLVGTWTLVGGSIYQGNATSEPFGPQALGTLVLDPGQRFVLLIARPDLPKFATARRDAGTPEENQAVLAGLLALMGTYRVSGDGQSLTFHVEAGTFPNWVGTDQPCPFTLTGDQMIWLHPSAIGPGLAQLVWRHAP